MFGELLAAVAAMAAVPVEILHWGSGSWLVIAATITGTLALLWYAYDLVSTGETPLTPRSAKRIRLVCYATDLELQGISFEWDNIDQQGRIPMDITNWSKLTPEGKDRYKRKGLDKALLSPDMITSTEPMWQTAALQVIGVAEDPDTSSTRTVLRIVEAPGDSQSER